MILASLILTQSAFRIGCPMKEEEVWRFDTIEVLKTEYQYLRSEERCLQKVLGIDDHGVQHIEVECVGGTVEETRRGEKQETEDPKGQTWNFYLNGNGQEFRYEEAKTSFEEDPLGYLRDLLHIPIERKAVVIGESWRRRTKLMDLTFKALPVKKVDKIDCVGLERTGVFLEPLSGAVKVTQWYRCDSGRLQSENTSVDDLSSEKLPTLDYTFAYIAKEK